jgi:hypothetical protein|tara:strand:+ start:1211 stop:1360 length:150 start_codon:yes stop_codon:yes gene_type:complete
MFIFFLENSPPLGEATQSAHAHRTQIFLHVHFAADFEARHEAESVVSEL